MRSIYTFIDVIRYLKTWFKVSGLNHAEVTEALGFKNKSYYHSIINGKKPVPVERIKNFEAVLDLSSKEFSYFKVLVAVRRDDMSLEDKKIMLNRFRPKKYRR